MPQVSVRRITSRRVLQDTLLQCLGYENIMRVSGRSSTNSMRPFEIFKTTCVMPFPVLRCNICKCSNNFNCAGDNLICVVAVTPVSASAGSVTASVYHAVIRIAMPILVTVWLRTRHTFCGAGTLFLDPNNCQQFLQVRVA